MRRIRPWNETVERGRDEADRRPSDRGTISFSGAEPLGLGTRLTENCALCSQARFLSIDTLVVKNQTKMG